jgi:hypothetical protein
MMASLLMTAALVGCDNTVLVPVGDPASPRNLDAYYYAGVVRVTWELAPDWNQETFRVYSKRVTDADWFLIAEVSSCAGGACTYEDRNIIEGQSYEYYVSAVDPDSGVEAPTDSSVQVDVPQATPPPTPTGFGVIALDHANYLTWSGNARDAADFSFYRVYFETGDDVFLLGETDSEGFLDQLAQNGQTYTYYVAAVDDQGHESDGSASRSGTPRPDYHGEWLYDHFTQPTVSGFRFQSDEATNPIVDGGSSDRHFRLEVDDAGWWLVSGPGTEIHPSGVETTALKCGVAADAGCVDVVTAPGSGYTTQDVPVASQTSYVLRVRGDDGRVHYGIIRVATLGFDQDDNALMVFDWAYQLVPDDRNLAPALGRITLR